MEKNNKIRLITYVIIGILAIAVIVLGLFVIYGGGDKEDNPRLIKAEQLIASQKKSIRFWKGQAQKHQVRISALENKIVENENNVEIIYKNYDEERNTVLGFSNDSAIVYFANWLSQEDSLR